MRFGSGSKLKTHANAPTIEERSRRNSQRIARSILMRHLLTLTLLLCSFFPRTLPAQTQSSPAAGAAPLRVGIAGLVHGHVDGFFHDSFHNPKIQIVGIAESNPQLFLRFASQYGVDRDLLFPSLEEMLQKVHPKA